MKQIYKYFAPVPGHHERISVPVDWEPIAVAYQGDSICIWAKHSLGMPITKKSIIIETVSTGWNFQDAKVIGTVFKDGFVWHIIYRGVGDEN